ncbi:hypothetical protein Tco_1440313 [Tanacetum coccineum]
MEICPIEGYQLCRVPVTIEKSYKVEILCIVDDIDECHILLGKPWRCEVNGKYDLKKNLYLFSWKGKRIVMVPPKVTPQIPKPDVKVEENIVKAEVVDEHIEKIQDLQSYKQHDDNILTLLCETTNKVDTLKTCEEIIGFNDDEDVKGFNCVLKTDFKCVHDLKVRALDYWLILRMIIKNHIKFSVVNKEAIFITIENLVVADKEHTIRCFGSWIDRWEYGRCIKKYEGFRVDVKRKSIEDKVRREKVFEVEEALNIENSRASSFQVRGINIDETKVNAVRDWSSLKTFPEVRNNKVENAFQEEYELQCAEAFGRRGETKKICSIIDGESCENLASKAWVKDFKLPIEPRHSPYQIGWIKKGLALKTWNVVASPKEFQAERKETGVSYALVVKGVEDVMENGIPAVINPLLAEFGKIMTDDAPNALPPLRNVQHQIDLSRKTTLLVYISNEVLGFNSIKELYASDEDFHITRMELETKQHRDCDEGSRPEEQHLVVSCYDEEIVKFPTQPATTEISGDNGSNLEDFLIVLTREEADIIRLIMVVEEEPLIMLGSSPNIIKEDFSNDLD